MAKPEWGTKRICPNCGSRYYDLRKQPPACPVCGTEYDPEALLRSRRARPVPVEEVKKAPTPVADKSHSIDTEEEALPADETEEDVAVEEIEEEEEAPPEDEEEVLIEDTSDLGEDDMEVVEVEGGVEDDEAR